MLLQGCFGVFLLQVGPQALWNSEVKAKIGVYIFWLQCTVRF